MKPEKKQILESFARAMATYDSHAVIQGKVAEQLLRLIKAHNGQKCSGQKIRSVLEIGCCTGVLTEKLIASHPQINLLHVNDLVPDFKDVLEEKICFSGKFSFLSGDIETIELTTCYDLIISSSTFHWLHDFKALSRKLFTRTDIEGMLAFSIYGPDNLAEIRTLTSRGLEYLTMAEIVAMLESDFVIMEAVQSLEYYYFPDPLAVLKHLRLTGVNALGGAGWTKKKLQVFVDKYNRDFQITGKGVRLTYHPIYILARPLSKRDS